MEEMGKNCVLSTAASKQTFETERSLKMQSISPHSVLKRDGAETDGENV